MSLPHQKADEPPSDSSTEAGVEREHKQENEMSHEPVDLQDVERDTTAAEADIHPRKDLPTWKWIFTIIALGLGAMLYGTAFYHLPKLRVSSCSFRSLMYSFRSRHYHRCRCSSFSVRRPWRPWKLALDWHRFFHGFCRCDSFHRQIFQPIRCEMGC